MFLIGVEMAYIDRHTHPCGNAAATTSKRYGRLLYPCRPEAVEEIGLACHLAVLEVRIAKLANIDLGLVSMDLGGRDGRSSTVSW